MDIFSDVTTSEKPRWVRWESWFRDVNRSELLNVISWLFNDCCYQYVVNIEVFWWHLGGILCHLDFDIGEFSLNPAVPDGFVPEPCFRSALFCPKTQSGRLVVDGQAACGGVQRCDLSVTGWSPREAGHPAVWMFVAGVVLITEFSLWSDWGCRNVWRLLL